MEHFGPYLCLHSTAVSVSLFCVSHAGVSQVLQFWGRRVFLNHVLPPDCLYHMERSWHSFSYVEKGSITLPTSEKALGVKGNPPTGNEQSAHCGRAQGLQEHIL